jgi:NifU-like protein involved in Fe-S cluster formation
MTSTEQPYSALVIEHFDRPRNRGSWEPGADVVAGHAGTTAQGVHFKLSARIAAARVQTLRFQAYGCPHCIASASWLTEQLRGGSLSALQQWSWREAAGALQVPPEKFGQLLVLEDALRALAADWSGRGRDWQG